MNFSLSICLLLMPTCLIAIGQVTDGAQVQSDYLESIRNAAEVPAKEILNDQEQIEDVPSMFGPAEGSSSSDEDQDFEDELSEIELEDFLSQFVLIKTPYGYILGRVPSSGEKFRAKRGRQQAEKNFQLRVRRADGSSNGSNFQLRVRKSAQNNNLSNFGLNASGLGNGRLFKGMVQEMRDRRQMAADHSNNNFQLRVRKSQERRTRGSAGKNFQLRVKRSSEW